MEMTAVALGAVFLIAYALPSGRLEKSIITPPMAFVAFGLLVGPHVLGIMKMELRGEVLKLLAELTLIIVLFTDASRIRLSQLRTGYNLPLRMLAIGMPLAFLFGWAAALWLLPGLGLWPAAVLAAILTPTDAALGQAVMSNPAVPSRIRQALNVESGLNDGLSVPILLMSLAGAAASEHAGDWGHWLGFFARQVTIGPLVGIGVGILGGKLVSWARENDYANHVFQDLAVLALSVLSYAAADLAGGNGLMAAFAAGLALGNVAPRLTDCLNEFGEVEGQLLVLITFLAFGGLMVWPGLMSLDWREAAYVALSLTLLRMIPVSLSLLGLKLRWPTHLFLGWFGPRGMASILFALLMLDGYDVPGLGRVFDIVMIAVLVSVLVHGVSAYPASLAYARSVENRKAKQPPHLIQELAQVAELPVRLPWRENSHRAKRRGV